MLFKFITGILLLIGAILGGGIVAIPIAAAQFGLPVTALLLVLIWYIMTKTGFYVIDLCVTLPQHKNSYFSIIGKYLGKKTQIVTVVLYLWLLYFSAAAYISGCTTIVSTKLPFLGNYLTEGQVNIVFVAIFMLIFAIGLSAVVRINSALVSIKLALIVFGNLYIFGNVPSPQAMHYNFAIFNWQGAALLMIIINSFGYQFIIPSLVNYFGKSNIKLIKRMLVTSTSIILVLYLTWLYTIYALVPETGSYGLDAIASSSNQLAAFNNSLQHYLGNITAVNLLQLFTSIALFCSFICVGLGIFDFLQDIFANKKRAFIVMLTFVPPLLISLGANNVYMLALSVAGYIAIFLEIILPILAKIRQLRSDDQGALLAGSVVKSFIFSN